METCDKEGMDPKVADCLSGLEAKVTIGWTRQEQKENFIQGG